MSKQYFKYGEREYSMDDLLKLHAKFENSFYNFAKEQGGYDQEALKRLRQSVHNRINALKSGQAFEGDGVLIGDSPDNITIRRRALRKKNRYIDQDNTEWAKYYLNKLVEGMDPYVKEEVKPVTFDNTAHSLSAYLTGNGIDANSIFSQLDLQDPNDLNKARGNSQRRAELRKQLEAYKAYLKQQGIDFGADSNTFNDDYLSTIDTALNNFDNLSDYDLSVLLRKLGAGDAYTTAFTSNKYSLKEETEEEKTARLKKEEEEKKKAEEELKQLRFKEAQNNFKDLKSTTINLGRKSNYQSILDGDKQKYGDFDSYYSDIADSEFPTLYGNTDLRSKPGTSAPEIAQKWQTQFNNLTNTLLTNPESVDPKLASAVMEAVYENNPDAFIQLEGGVTYIPNTANDSGYAVTYNPSTNTLYRSSLHELAQYNKTNQNIMNDYKRILNNRIKAQHNVDYSDPNEGYVFAEGGVLIPKNQYGGGITLDASKFGEYYKDRAQENDVDEKTQRARDRYINEDNKSTLNPEAGFTANQWAKLATMGVNLGSMFLDPVTGTVVGAGATVIDFINDMTDDSVSTGDAFKNLGTGLAFDAVGAIPVVGDALGTGSKILRTAVSLAPTALAVLGAYQGVKNYDGMKQAWKKLVSSGEDAKMTVQDWQNLAQSIQLFTGGVRVGRNYVRSKKAVREATDDKKAIVDVIDDKGNKQQMVVGGKTFDKIAEIQRNGGDPVKIKEALSEIEGYKDKFGENGKWKVVSNNKWYSGWQLPWGKNQLGETKLRGIKGDGKASVREYVDYNKVRDYYTNRARFGSSPFQKAFDTVNPKTKSIDASNRKTSAEVDEMVEQAYKNANIEDLAKKIPEAVNERKTQLADIDTKLQEAQSKIDAANGAPKKSDLLKTKAQLEQRINKLPNKKYINQTIKSSERAINKKQQLDNDELIITQNHDKAIAELKATQKKLNVQLKLKQKKQDDLLLKAETNSLSKGEKGQLTKITKEIEDLKGQIYIRQGLTNKINNINNDFNIKKASIDNARIQLNAVIQKGNSMKSYKKKYDKQNNKLQEINKNLKTVKRGQQARWDSRNLNNQKSSLDPNTNPTAAYTQLQNTLNNMPKTIGGRKVTWDMKDILSKYGINSADVFKQGGNIQLFQKGGVKRYKNYDKTDKEECAEFSNNDLRKLGHLIYGNAWNLQNADLLYSGYNNNVRPRKWNLKDVEKYNADASDNFYKNFDSRTLDKEKQYAVNMYYKGSPSQETAYNDGRDGIAGTHTGYIQYNDDLNRWDLIHNIHRTVHVDPFTETQGSGKQYGVTAIFEPRKNTFINRVKDIFGFQNGGTIDEQNNNKDSIDKEQLIKYLKYAKR